MIKALAHWQGGRLSMCRPWVGCGVGARAVPAAPAAFPAATWGKAIQVPGAGTLNKGGYAAVTAMSCGSAGNCAAGGDYRDRRGHLQGFVAVERSGQWARAMEVPGLGALNTGRLAEVTAVSCGSAGNCAAGGDYRDGRGRRQAFVAVDRNGRWRTAIEVPGLAALNTGGYALIGSVWPAPAQPAATTPTLPVTPRRSW